MRENEIIIDSIKNTINDIAYDKDRLNKIIEAINKGDVAIDINDRLINSLNKLDVDNDVIQTALEYLTLILSNLESQKINNTKNVTSELIIILNHVLNGVRNLEHCALQLTTEIETHKKLIAKHHGDPDVKKEETKVETKKNNTEIWKSLMPNNKVSNIMLWVMGFILFLVILFKIEPNLTKKSLDEVNHIVHKVEGGPNGQ